MAIVKPGLTVNPDAEKGSYKLQVQEFSVIENFGTLKNVATVKGEVKLSDGSKEPCSAVLQGNKSLDTNWLPAGTVIDVTARKSRDGNVTYWNYSSDKCPMLNAERAKPATPAAATAAPF